MKRKQESKKFWQKPHVLSGIILGAIILLLVCAYFVYVQRYQNKVYPQTYFGKQKVAGISSNDLRKLINERSGFLDQGANICFENDCLIIKSATTTLSTTTPIDLVIINKEETYDEIYNFGHSNNFGTNLWQRLANLIIPRQENFIINIDHDGLVEVLKNYFDDHAQSVKEADLNVSVDGTIQLEAEANGWKMDYEQALNDLTNKLSQGDNSKIILKTIIIKPTIYKANVLNLDPQISSLLSVGPRTWQYQDKKWQTSDNQAKSWLGLELNQAGKPEVVFSKAKIQKYLETEIAPKVVIKSTDPEFNILDGKVFVEKPAEDGLEINYEASVINFFTSLAMGQSTVDLAMEKVENQNKELSGIDTVQILGIGTSTFTGSSTSRKHNIRTGAGTINGTIIKPGEEFSLIRALGRIDASSGYLQELVIKENKTMPEYGGGLCQVGTTLFRAVVDAGFPVTSRRNHSYRVSYYEPAGTDATIYDPQPDFRFINDTGNTVLLQTVIGTNSARFTFWGTPDGRKVIHTYPTIYNIVKPGPTKLIETDTLKPGVKKCTEKAHNGADAFFDYKVTYPSGDEKNVRFSSHYVPWREVCLIGVSATSTPPIASSTTEVPATTTSN